MSDAEKPEEPEFGEVPHLPKEGRYGAPAPEDSLANGSNEDEPLGDEEWPESAELGRSEASAQEMASYWALVRRVERMTVVAGGAVAVAVGWRLGWVVGACLLMGAAMAWMSFHWLAASINAVGERIVKSQSGERGDAIVARGIGRIFLIGLFAYVIFTYSVRGLIGFLAGLTMPVLAMMCEVVYEFAARNRRPF